MNEFEAHESSYDHQHKKVGFYSLARKTRGESHGTVIADL
jgi:hypothetical protein